MKQLLFTTILLLSTTLISAQCLSGNCENGFGKIKYADGSILEGTFENGLLNGLGVAIYPDGNYYIGQFVNAKFDGFGYLQNPDGQNFIGQWENGKQQGFGIYTDINSNPTAGIWDEAVFKSAKSIEANPKNPTGCEGNCIDGYGRIRVGKNLIQAIFNNGNATFGRIFNEAEYTYDGQIENNLPNGYGQMIYNSGEHYFGFFKNGLKNGKGILSANNKPRVYGTWENDVYIPFDSEDFCNEIESLAKGLPLEYNAWESEDFWLETTLNQKFLNQYDIVVHSNVDQSFFFVSYSTTIRFPQNDTAIPKVSLEQINTALGKCKKLLRNEDASFTFKANLWDNSVRTSAYGDYVYIMIDYNK